MWAKAPLERRALRERQSGLEGGYGTTACDEKRANDGHMPSRATTLRPLPETWMSSLDDGLPLSAITIPGTHDSAAFTYAWPFVATQDMSIREQLDAGIRYFDFRCGLRENTVEMVHGPTYLGLRLEEVLQAMYDWLDTHKSEGLIVQIKRDKKDSKSTVDFAHAIAKVLRQGFAFWRTANTTPSIAQLRGRIQLFRRFQGPSLYAYGIDVSQWQDNPRDPFTIYTSHGTQLTVQDHYSWPDPTTLPTLVAEKGGDVAGLLNRAADDLDVHHWYINFTSAYEFNFYYQISPREIALGGYWGFKWEAGMNVRLRNYLAQQSQRRKRYGIVAMDFPEAATEDLVMELILTNFERDASGCWDVICFWIPLMIVLAAMCILVIALLA